MSKGEPQPASEAGRADFSELQGRLKQLEHRDAWMWATALLLLILLCAAVASLVAAIVLQGKDAPFQLQIGLALRGLIGLVLLFSVYVLYQQVLIRGLRRRLVEQMDLSSHLGMKAEEFQRLALLDPLTELYNRRFVTDRLQAEMDRSDRHGQPLTALMLDLDGLKTINDRFGHGAGDRALVAFAECLRSAVRSSDLPARVGGDEFLVILPECHPELVPRVLARLSGLEIQFDSTSVPLQFAAGWAAYEPGETGEEIIARADQILCRNKHTGRVEEQIRQVKADVRRAQKMEALGRLAGGIAHDFNNILMVIRGYSELLLSQLGEGDPQRRFAEESLKAADRAVSLTRQLLAFGRQQELAARVLDLNEVVRDMHTMLARVIGEHIELVTELDPALARVKADPTQLEQVIMNLAANARDAMPGGGRLTLKTTNVQLDEEFTRRHRGSRPGAYLLLAVSDTGAGMDKKTQERIFEPYFTTKELGRGTGLGLATVYGIVKQNGGYIAVDSAPGVGSSFRIFLPVADRAEAATPVSPPGVTESA